MSRHFKIKSAAVAASCLLVLTGCSGGGGSDPAPPQPTGGGQPVTPPPPPPTGGGGDPVTPPPASSAENTVLASDDQAARFLAAASFGAGPGDAAALSGNSASGWITSQAQLPATLFLDDVLSAVDETGRKLPDSDNSLYWNKVILADDQLRQRMVFALSQIIVISDEVVQGRDTQNQFANYRDILSRNALGNYRTLLQEITYSTAMADWLTYMQNQKGDPESGRMPDENYARELLQLFTIGLVELNLDGTPVLSAGGQDSETFGNDDVAGLAKVFTGLSFETDEFHVTFRDVSAPNVPTEIFHMPLKVFPEEHSQLEKSFLGHTIPAGTPAEQSINEALDHIFNHPNVGPFVARQLIQRFTASNPEPAYVERVATAFNEGRFVSSDDVEFGTGERGDLLATIAAVLLDDDFFDPDRTVLPSDGKIQEPVLRLVHWARIFDAQNIDAANQPALENLVDPNNGLGQHPFRSPSVFNFYRPGYVAPGTESGARDITAPEFQIVNASSQYGTFNTISEFAFAEVTPRRDAPVNFVPDYSEELPLAFDEQALVAHLNDKVAGARLSAAEIEEIEAVVELMDARTNTAEREAEDRFHRVGMAVSLVMTAPNYVLLRQYPETE